MVDLSISCKDLINRDTLSKSDPACVVKLRNVQTGKWKQIGCTERIKNKLSPQFIKSIPIEYFFEQTQCLKFQIYDVDVTPTKPWIGKIDKDDDILGSLEIELGEICGERGQVVTKLLKRPKGVQILNKKKSYITIRADERKSTTNETVYLNFSGIKLKKMDGLFGKSDPYFILKKKRQNKYFSIYKSEIVKSDLNPRWKQVALHISQLCSGNKDELFKLECWDWDQNSDDDMIGYCEMSLNQIKKGKRIELKYKNKSKRGTIEATAKCIRNYSFFEYLTGGLELNLITAIDFTGSNGNPSNRGTLHYHDPKGLEMNEYQSAIMSIGNILQNYDSDKVFPSFGFGGKIGTGVSHCFALNGNPNNPSVVGINGILQAYKQALFNVALYGPTYFSQVINQTTAIASQEMVCQDVQKYFTLLLLTDGVLNDYQKTVDAIVDASYYPISIIIIGVGNANFSKMDQLDADNGLLVSSSGKTAMRDIVQFVPYSQWRAYGMQKLSEETLKELPGQISQFFKMKGIIPNQRPNVTGLMSTTQNLNNQQNVTVNCNKNQASSTHMNIQMEIGKQSQGNQMNIQYKL